ncbi:MAG: hypothetical protein IKX06_01770 [Clostridia bacterium]|nr:hypothetical protein [Clostridia bacterium]
MGKYSRNNTANGLDKPCLKWYYSLRRFSERRIYVLTGGSSRALKSPVSCPDPIGTFQDLFADL